MKIYTDDRGNLIPLQFNELKFIPKRIFTVSDVPKDSIRGEHAHYETIQYLWCVKGKILVSLDDGKNIKEEILNPGQGIYIDNFVWDYQKFLTGDDVIVVLASTYYDINDYIINKETFYKIVNNNDTSNNNS